MVDFIKINSKFIIPTEEKRKEIFAKLTPGETLTARVSDVSDNGKAIINIKGTDVLTESGRELKKGDVISVTVQNIDSDKIMVKINDNKTIVKDVNGNKIAMLSEKMNELKNGIIETVVNGNILINDKKIDAVMNKYLEIKMAEYRESSEGKINNETSENKVNIKNIVENLKISSESANINPYDKINKENNKIISKIVPDNVLPEIIEKASADIENDKNIIKTLSIMEKYNLEFNDRGFRYIKSYFEKANAESIEIDENLKKNIKKAVENIKQGKEDIDKGTNIINALNQAEEKRQIEFVLQLENSLPAEIKINYDEKNENGEKEKIDKNNFTLSLKLSLENLGDLEIKTAVWNKHMGLIFGLKDKEKLRAIMENVTELNSRLTGMGYIVDEIKGKIETKEEIKIKGVNVEA